MRIALFVDPTEAEYTAAIETATFVAQTATGLGKPLVLSCGPSAALEIGLAVLGQSAARTIEGGKRPPSPLILLPMIRDAEGVDSRLRPESDEDSPGTLADLVDLGVIASRDEIDVNPFSDTNPVESFAATLRNLEVSTVVGLGSQSHFWSTALHHVHEIQHGQLLAIPELAPADLPFEDARMVRVLRTQIPDRPIYPESDRISPVEDEFEEYVIAARRQAALIAAIIQSLLAERRPGSHS